MNLLKEILLLKPFKVREEKGEGVVNQGAFSYMCM